MGLAYEIVINSDPCIAYLMEENTMCMQALVIAHACYGHNSFFKGNYLFRSWTDASSIIDYLVFAKQYIVQCEERHGIDAVEDLLQIVDVPVIFITAYPEKLLTGERPEPTYLITKPFREATVRAAISQALFFGSSRALA
jgi:hypothetical protein